MPKATGTFEVTSAHEDAYHEQDGQPKLTRAGGTQRFRGDVEGDGLIEWLMCYVPEGGARFVGIQRIEGGIGDRRGTFIVEAVGTFDGAKSEGTWRIVDGAATGDLAGMRGTGGFEAPGGPKGTYHLEYELP